MAQPQSKNLYNHHNGKHQPRLKSFRNKGILLLITFWVIGDQAFANSVKGDARIVDTAIFSLLVVSSIVFLVIIYTQIVAVIGVLEKKEIIKDKNYDKKDIGNGFENIGIIIALLLITQRAMAQGEIVQPLITMTHELYWMLIGLNVFLLGIIITLHYILNGLIRSIIGLEEKTITNEDVNR